MPFLFFAILQATGAATGGEAAPAPGATGDAPPPGGMESLLSGMLVPMVLCMLVFYFFMIGPERKQRKKREQLLSNLQKGQKVMTTGGMYGTVAQVQDQVVTLQIADGVRVRYALSSVQSVIEDEPASAQKAC